MSISKMKPTRFPGVYTLPDGRLFVRVAHVGPDGRQRKAHRVMAEGSTPAQALTIWEELKADLRSGVTAAHLAGRVVEPEGTGGPPTLRDFSTRWLTIKAPTIRQGVAKEWAFRLAYHVLPVPVNPEGHEIGDLPLDRIRKMALLGWVAHVQGARQKSGKPYAQATLTGWWRLLGQVLRDGCFEYDVPFPVPPSMRGPVVHVPRVRELKTLTRAQLGAFLAAVELHQPARLAELTFIGMTGCRAGEALGLHWKDVVLEPDADGPARATLCHSATGGRLERTKTNAPRTVPLVPGLVEALRQHRKAQMAGKIAQSKDGLVFPAENGGLRLEQSLAKPCALCSHGQGVGQKVTPQVLRRSLNTILVTEGVDPITIREMLGHTGADMTVRYANVPISVKAAAMARALGA
jgi:integrase